MKTKCQNQKCNYEWEYNGKKEFYATCPNCLYKVNLKGGQIKNGRKTETNRNTTTRAVEHKHADCKS